MSLPLVILTSIAAMLETAEASPLHWSGLNRRAADDSEKEFSNATTTTVKKTTTKRVTTTTKKENTAKASSAHATTTHTASAHATTTHAASAHATSAHVSSTQVSSAEVSSAEVSSAEVSSTQATSAQVTSDVPSSTASPSPTSTSVTPMLVPAGTNSASSFSSAATPTATALADTSSSGVSGGAIGGIVAAVVIIIAGAVAYCFVRRKKNNTSRGRHLSTKPDPFTMGYGSDQAFHNPPMQQNYQHQYGVQPAVAATSPSSAQYNNSTPQFQDASSHNIAEAAAVPQQQYQTQPQEYQPQLSDQYNNEHVDIPTPLPVVAAVAAADTVLSPTQSGSVGVFHVAATYTPTLSDEIDIQTGDQVEVLVEYDDGWCQGINLSRGNAKGVFPKHCIDYASSVSPSDNSIDRSKRVSSMYIG